MLITARVYLTMQADRENGAVITRLVSEYKLESVIA